MSAAAGVFWRRVMTNKALMSSAPANTAQVQGAFTANTETCVLLLNLGTPDAPTAAALRRYLGEFLSDRRVVELPPLLWQPILQGVIKPLRSPRSARKYAEIWTPQGAPLLRYTQRISEAVAQRLSAYGLNTRFAMTYGQPSIAATLKELSRSGTRRLIVVPLFPQYAASSTAAALDKVWRVLLAQRYQMQVTTITDYHDFSPYIQALAASVRRHWQHYPRQKLLLMSFHSIPVKSVAAGDPYQRQCENTARLLAQALDLPDDAYRVVYQSRFGTAKWLQPATAATLAALPGQGIDGVEVICPGFSTDCLETLEEIAIAGRDTFLAAGGKHFHYIPCLNDDTDWMDALTQLILAALPGTAAPALGHPETPEK